MRRTPSRETWTSAEAVTGHRLYNYGTKYRSQSLRRHRGLQLRNWLVYFRDMLQKPVREHVRGIRKWLRYDYGLHRGDPNILTKYDQLIVAQVTEIIFTREHTTPGRRHATKVG
jgi:hypothetical protein